MSPTIKRNVLFAGITNAADFLPFILMIAAARYFGPELYGTFRLALALGMTFLAFSDLGMNHLAIRDISRDRSVAPRYLGNILTWKIFLAVLAFGALVFTSSVFRQDPPAERALFTIIGLAMVLRFFSLTGRCFLHPFERFETESLAVATEQFILIGGGFLVLVYGYGPIPLACLFLFARAVGFLLTFGLLNRIVPVHFAFDPSFVLSRQKEALPIGLAFGVLMAYVQMDTLILSSLASKAEVGIYNSAYSIYYSLAIIPSVIATVFLPRLSLSFKNDLPAFRKLLIQGSEFLLLVAVGISVVGWFTAPWFIPLLYDESYVEAVLPMRVLFVASVFTFQTWLLRIVLISTDQQKAFMWIYVIGLAVRVVAGIFLIGRMGIVGAAAAALASEAFVFLCMWAFLLSTHFRAGQKSHIPGKVAGIVIPASSTTSFSPA